jgi:two-component system response regulator YesN
MCGVIIEMLRQYLNLASFAGISSLKSAWKDSAQLMIDAVRATEEIFFRGYGIIVYSSELETETPALFSPAVYDWEEPYRQALELREIEKIKSVFKTIQDILLSGRKKEVSFHRISRAEAFNLCFTIAGVTLSTLKKQSSQPFAFDENLYETIGIIETLEGLLEWTKLFEEKIIGFFDALPEKSSEDQIVVAAKRYIAKNCRRSISLNSAAKDLSISAGYLSSVFKRQTNTGFVEYITMTKIDEAKKLLLSGQYKVYEVSDMIGYEDNGYFSKTFHKVTGMSPGEFMKKHI